MKWFVLALLIVSFVFVGLYLATGNIWLATNSAGALCLLYVIGVTAWATQPPMPRGTRLWTFACLAVVVAGVALFWVLMWMETDWQYERLRTMQQRLAHGVITASLHNHAVKTLDRYTQQRGERSLARAFAEVNPTVSHDTALIDTLFQQDGICIYGTAVNDSQAVLTGQALFTEGADPAFRNYDGRTGMIQDRLLLTTKGVTYEVQN